LVEDVHSGIDGLPPGEYLLLAVADNGCGIPPELQEKVFDPFFSTKSADRGRGSGLGLSIVQTIVSDHVGRVVLESEVGKGTVFKVYLPVKPRWMDEVATG
jgi:signal transduction histidine kinase